MTKGFRDDDLRRVMLYSIYTYIDVFSGSFFTMYIPRLVFFRIIFLITLIILFLRLNILLLQNSELNIFYNMELSATQR